LFVENAVFPPVSPFPELADDAAEPLLPSDESSGEVVLD
jgi:hypothetical protein